MEIADLPKDARRFFLQHWSEAELSSRLLDPEYFIDQLVSPRLDYLRRLGEEVPRIRLQKMPSGEFRILLTD